MNDVKVEKDIFLDKLKAGDDDAFSDLVSHNWDNVLNQAYGILNNRQDAEEVAQDTFLRARKSLPNFRGDCSVSTWLYQIATNLAKNKHWYWWRRKRHCSFSMDMPVSADESVNLTLADTIACELQNPIEESLSKEFEAEIPKAISEMPPLYAEVMRLRNEEELSYDEIALKLNVGLGTVKSRLSRAREFLRDRLSAIRQ